MKHNLRFFLLAALMSMACIAASAHDFEVDGIYYNYNNGSEGTSVSVTYSGTSYSSVTNEYSGVINIPESVIYNGQTYSVTGIVPKAFADCSSQLSVIWNRTRRERQAVRSAGRLPGREQSGRMKRRPEQAQGCCGTRPAGPEPAEDQTAAVTLCRGGA